MDKVLYKVTQLFFAASIKLKKKIELKIFHTIECLYPS